LSICVFPLFVGCFEFQRLLVLSAQRNSRRLNVIVAVGVAAGPAMLLPLSLLQPLVSAHERTLSSGKNSRSYARQQKYTEK